MRNIVTHQISTVRIHLTSIVALDHVNLRLVDETNNLDVVGGLDELHTGERAFGDETSAVSGLGAPGDHGSFDISDIVAGFGGGPEAEVWKQAM